MYFEVSEFNYIFYPKMPRLTKAKTYQKPRFTKSQDLPKAILSPKVTKNIRLYPDAITLKFYLAKSFLEVYPEN